jgi:tRNA(fMet)-specific endonuclease VapC
VKYLLDTNTCIGWLRLNQPKLVMRIKQSAPDDLAICSIVVSELVYGIERGWPAHQATNRMKVEQLRQQFVSLAFDDAAAEVCGNVRAFLARLGTPIGPNDLLIASIAVANNMVLVSHNTSEFSRVPGLMIEDWQ